MTLAPTAYESTKRIRAQRRRFAVAVKTTAGCIDCGATGPAERLHFDHRDGEEKLFEVARGGTASWPRFVAEILKCDVRCASCHTSRHRRVDPVPSGFRLGQTTETDFELQIEQLASMLGWEWVHFCDSRRQVRPGVYVGDSKARGWPDLVLCRDRLVHAELKSASGKLRPHQRTWLDGLANAGGEVYLWRPMDWDEIAGVLSRDAWEFQPGGVAHENLTPCLVRRGTDWLPKSMWIHGVGRTDQDS